jgi:diguanylate cyclase (GGDEF)-like protein/PAS domain S-box-containing protein
MVDTGPRAAPSPETVAGKPAGAPMSDDRPESRATRLLIIDDNAAVRETFGYILRRAGYHVTEAADGAAGLRHLRGTPPDLMLTALEMPGLSGWDVAREACRLYPDLPVVLVTGNPDAREVETDLRGSVRAILLKPFGARQLLDVVGGLAAEHPSRRVRFRMQTGRQLSILLVEDNAGDARLIQEYLRGNPVARLAWADSLAAAQPHLARPDLDLVLLDLGLPDSQGLDTVARIVGAHPTLPVIVLTGRQDGALALAALTAGAEDYLVKGAIEPGVLVRSIQYAYERKRAELTLREAYEFSNQIVLHVQEGIVVYDRDLRYRIWNPFMEALSGIAAADVTGRHVHAAPQFWTQAGVIAALQRALDGEVVTLPEIAHCVAGSGREGWTTVTFGPLRDAQGMIIGVIANVRDITLRKQAEELLRSQSTMDELTGLHNRRGFLTLAQEYLKLADRNREAVLLVFADLDDLKTVNDTLGHRAGDQALQDVAAILRQTFRASDIIARLGGDEFAILAMESPMASREGLLARLQQNLAAHNAGRAMPLSLSLGVAGYDRDHPCALEELLARADAAMYAQKWEKRKR